MPAEELAPGVYRIRLGRVNSYLVRSGEMAVLVDSGVPAHVPALVGVLGELGLYPHGLAAVVLTHRHLDHAGGAAALRERCAAEVLVHDADAAAVRGEERLTPGGPGLGRLLAPLVAVSDRRVFRYRGCPVTPIREGWQGHGLRLVHLAGHTPGHSGLLHEASNIVFAGDAAMTLGGTLRGPPPLFTIDPIAARRSLWRLAELDAALYCFGHGAPLLRGAEALRVLAERT